MLNPINSQLHRKARVILKPTNAETYTTTTRYDLWTYQSLQLINYKIFEQSYG
jgi:hypothetical protein